MEISAIVPITEINTASLASAIFYVIKLRDVGLTGLKQQNNNLEDMVLKKEEGKEKLEERCQELINQNAKLNKQVVGQMALQGIRIINPPLSNLVICLNQESIQSIFSH